MTGRPIKTFLLASFAIIFGAVQIACFCSPGFVGAFSHGASIIDSHDAMPAMVHMENGDHSSEQHPDIDCDKHCLDQQISAVKPLVHNSFIAGSNAPDKTIIRSALAAPSWLEIASPQAIIRSWIDPPKPRLSPVALRTRLLN